MAKRKSIHAKLYKFTYSSNLPNNLCPYFYKLILAIILFIPNFILSLPAIIYNFVTNDFDFNPIDRLEKSGKIFLITIIGLIYLFSTYHLGKAIFHCYSYNSEVVKLGITFNLVILFFGILFGIFCIHEHYSDKKFMREMKGIKEEKEPNIIIEFVKAKYHKYCPKIDWED